MFRTSLGPKSMEAHHSMDPVAPRQPFEPGAVLWISTASYRSRRYTVVTSNRHRTTLRGPRGAERSLVIGSGLFDVGGRPTSNVNGHIFEVGKDRDRAQPCTVVLDINRVHAKVQATLEAIRVPDRPGKAQAKDWAEISERNRSTAAESLASAMVKIVAGDFRGAQAEAERAARRLGLASAFEYVARKSAQ